MIITMLSFLGSFAKDTRNNFTFFQFQEIILQIFTNIQILMFLILKINQVLEILSKEQKQVFLLGDFNKSFEL